MSSEEITKVSEVSGSLDASQVRVAIVASRFNSFIVERLVDGAVDTLRRTGGSPASITVVRCPGAFELPAVARRCVDSQKFDAVICLGAVIRGETDHYDYVCAEAARGIQDVQLRTGVPTAFGVLTVDTMEQALARSGGDTRDSGRHAADAVLALLAVRDRLSRG